MAKTLISQSNIKLITVREATPLATSYTASDNFNVQGANQLQLMVSFVKGESGGCRLKIEFSEDESTWYQESIISEYSSGDVKHKPITRGIDDSGNVLLSLPISASYFRISSQALTSGTNTSLSILATIANI